MALKACEDWDKLAFGEMGILLICPNYPMPICSGAHFSWWPFPPNAHLPSITKYCPNVHRSQSAHLPHKCQYSSVPMCSFSPQCPFALVLIFSGAHFPQCPLAPMSIGPNVHICSTVPICLINAHLLWCSFFLASIYPKCPFAPNAHLPQCSSVLNCPFAPKCPLCPKVPISL